MSVIVFEEELQLALVEPFEAGVLVIEESSQPTVGTDVDTGDVLIFDAEPVAPTVVQIEPDLIVIDEPSPPDVRYADSDAEVVLISSGLPGPPGPPGPEGPPGPTVDLEEHVLSPLPHPAYDDMLDLTLIFENHLI